MSIPDFIIVYAIGICVGGIIAFSAAAIHYGNKIAVLKAKYHACLQDYLDLQHGAIKCDDEMNVVIRKLKEALFRLAAQARIERTIKPYNKKNRREKALARKYNHAGQLEALCNVAKDFDIKFEAGIFGSLDKLTKESLPEGFK